MKAFFKENKLIITSIFTFVCAIVAVAMLGFAWFAESDTGKAGGIVSQIGDLGSQYQFGQILAGSDSEFTPREDDFFEYDEILPGSTYTFAISVANDGTIPGYFSVYLYNVLSCYLHDEIKNYEYAERKEKIQYAFNYTVKEVYWTPFSSSLTNLTVNQDDPLPSDEYISEHRWLKWTDQEKMQYFPSDLYTESEGVYTPKTVVFNKEDANGNDKGDYYLINRANLNPNSELASDKSAFVIFFQFDFLSSPILPDSISDQTLPNSNVYINQIIQISNIVIVATKD